MTNKLIEYNFLRKLKLDLRSSLSPNRRNIIKKLNFYLGLYFKKRSWNSLNFLSRQSFLIFLSQIWLLKLKGLNNKRKMKYLRLLLSMELLDNDLNFKHWWNVSFLKSFRKLLFKSTISRKKKKNKFYFLRFFKYVFCSEKKFQNYLIVFNDFWKSEVLKNHSFRINAVKNLKSNYWKARENLIQKRNRKQIFLFRFSFLKSFNLFSFFSSALSFNTSFRLWLLKTKFLNNKFFILNSSFLSLRFLKPKNFQIPSPGIRSTYKYGVWFLNNAGYISLLLLFNFWLLKYFSSFFVLLLKSKFNLWLRFFFVYIPNLNKLFLLKNFKTKFFNFYNCFFSNDYFFNNTFLKTYFRVWKFTKYSITSFNAWHFHVKKEKIKRKAFLRFRFSRLGTFLFEQSRFGRTKPYKRRLYNSNKVVVIKPSHVYVNYRHFLY